MKINFVFKVTIIILLSFKASYSQNFKRCSTVEHEESLQKKHPKRFNTTEFENWIKPLIKEHQLNRNEIGGVVIIPVVVHVIHSGQNTGIAPNIDDLQVLSQIEVLNNDFRKKIGTPGYNANPIGSDTQIQFALAQVDPNGNPTNGIDRVYLNKENWSRGEIEEIVKPQTIWDPSLYLNMWTVNFSDSKLLGYAQFPDASGLLGLNTDGGLGSTDGVVSNYVNFGSRLIYPNGLYADNKYDKGRTMTHEVGHWIGLRHIWGDEACGDDYCADTPTAHGENYSCPTIVNCSNTGNEMVENYMDYTDDSCMNIFTENQKSRMVVIMNNATRRKSLKTSTKDQPLTLFANDAEIKIERELIEFANSCQISGNPTKKITITNRGTSMLTSAIINYNINNGTTQSYNWSGSLTINQSSTFDLEVVANVDDVINVSIAQVNGVLDQRTTNNIVTAKILPLKLVKSYHYDFVTFNLQLDNYGSEVTWEFKNKAGNVLFSGGPYNDGSPELITQTWELKDKECYELTINDSGGDGLCCDFGEGRYELSNYDNIIASGGRFGSTEVTGFSSKFVNLENDVVLYGNPVKDDELKFIIEKDFGKNITCRIYSFSGRLIKEFNPVHSELRVENVSNLSSGMYFLSISSNTKTKTLKFIKI